MLVAPKWEWRPILFQSLGFYYIDNQSVMLDKNLTAGSILEEWP